MTSRKVFVSLVAMAVLVALVMVVKTPTPVMAHKDSVVNQTISLTLGDFYYQVEGQPKNAPITVTAGQLVRFLISNKSELTHEMHMGRKANPAEQKYDEPLNDMYDSVWLGPGQSAELWILIPDKPGEWELACFHEEHYNSGMHAPLIIQPKP
ncbi:multicopper oxidase domain-containing protein [Candidatus Acetothermia bacterium]|nr:multicopper oxidase domain-containing protein [Candidatus Acetothermia bacterium]